MENRGQQQTDISDCSPTPGIFHALSKNDDSGSGGLLRESHQWGGNLWVLHHSFT